VSNVSVTTQRADKPCKRCGELMVNVNAQQHYCAACRIKQKRESNDAYYMGKKRQNARDHPCIITNRGSETSQRRRHDLRAVYVASTGGRR